MKFCPNCEFELPKTTLSECPDCGFNLSTNKNKTIRLDESAKTIRDVDADDDNLTSAPTVREIHPDDVSQPPNDRQPTNDTLKENTDATFEIDDDDDLFSSDSATSFDLDEEPNEAPSAAQTVNDDDDLFGDDASDVTVAGAEPELFADDGSQTIDDDDDLFAHDTARTSEPIDADASASSDSNIVDDDDDLFASDSGDVTVTGNTNTAVSPKTIDDDDDLFASDDSSAQDIGYNANTIQSAPMQTMSRPVTDSNFDSTIDRPPSGRSSRRDSKRGSSDKTTKARNAPTIANPQAALEAAEAYSEGLQALIPPRTMVRKEDSAENSDYQVTKRLGAGAFGVVFRARQVPLERSVAIKLLQNDSDNEAQQQRIKNEFLREAQFTGRLEHPNIVPIHDIGLTVSVSGKASPFYVMKEIRGQSWHGEIRKKSVKENLEIFKNVVNAIGFAHSQNILHCDLKPDNVMLGEFGEVLVVDWGQAVDLSVPETMRPGGTPAYIAPEMAKYWIEIYLDRKRDSPARADVGFRSDVYLLGAILFEIVVGFPPHCKNSEDSPYDVIRRAANSEIVDYVADSDSELLQIALAALRKTDTSPLETIEDLSEAIAQYENRSASIDLRRRADELLGHAQEAEDYDDYQRARFGYEESIQKWDSNQLAIEGLRQSKLSCAQQALSDQNFDLGLDVLQNDAGDEESELRRKLKAGKRTRDRRKRMVVFLAAGLAGSILVGIAVNGYMIDQNLRSMTSLDIALKQKAEVEESIEPLRQEAIEKQKEILAKEAQIAQKQSLIESKQSLIDEFPAKIAKKNEEFNNKIAQKEIEFQQKEKELEQKMAANVVKFNQETAELEQQKQKLANQKEELVGQVVQLNESSKLLRYKSGLNQIQADLENGEFRDARRQLDQYPNQTDWEIKRLNLYAHREIQSLYPNRSVQAVALGGEQVAIALENKIELRQVADLPNVNTSVAHADVTALGFSPTGQHLFVGQPGANDRKPGQISVYNVSSLAAGRTIKTFDAQSGSVDQIEVTQDGNLMLSVGKVSPLRQSSGTGLEEPLMVWDNGQPVDVDLVLPDGSKPKFDSASFSESGNRILLANGSALQRDQTLHVFERTNLGYRWLATCPVAGVSAATFAPGTEDAVLAAATDSQTGEHSLIQWRFAETPLSQAADSPGRQNAKDISVVSPLDSKIVQLRRQGKFIASVDANRRTTVWDWQSKQNIELVGQSHIADACFVIPGNELGDCKIVTAALGDRAEILVTDIADYQQEILRKQIGWYASDLPPSVTASAFSSTGGKTVEAFGNDRAMAVVDAGGNRTQWNISAWHSHVASDQFVFAQSSEDFIYVFDRRTGALLKVLTEIATLLDGQERVTKVQVSDDGKTALLQTDSQRPEFRIWNLENDSLIRKVDYGKQNLFGTGSKKLVPRLQLSRDGKWVVGAKVGVYAWNVGTGELTRFKLDQASAPRSTANSIVFLRNSPSNDFLVSWRQRLTRFTASNARPISTQRIDEVSDAAGRPNLLDAIQTQQGFQFLALNRSDDGGIVWMDADRKSPLANFENTNHATFVAAQEIGVVAGGAGSGGKLRILRLKRAGGTIQTIEMERLQSKIGQAKTRGFEKLLWSPEAGFLLQTTERNKQSVRRMWNSISFSDIDSTAVVGRAKVLASPVIDHIVTNGKKVATLSSNTLHFWILTDEGVQPDGVFGQPVSSVSLSSDQKLLAVGTPTGDCKILDFETGTELARTENMPAGETSQVTSLAWHPQSNRLAAGAGSGHVFEIPFDRLNPKAIRYDLPLKLQTSINKPIGNLVYSQDGSTLVVNIPGQGLAIALANITGSQPASEIVLEHSDEQNIVATDISANGNRIVTGSDKGQLAVWNIDPAPGQPSGAQAANSSERLLLRLANLHQSPISLVKFVGGDNGEMIVSSESDSRDNAILVWPTAPVESKIDK